MASVVIELPDVIEIKSASEFDMWAIAFGVEVGRAGQKPKGKLARAIRDYDKDDLPTTIIDTPYFSASMADGPIGTGSEYGTKLAALRKTRDDAIATARAAFDKASKALKVEYGVTESATRPTRAAGYVVTATTPMLDKSGSVLRTKANGDKPGPVRFRNKPSRVELSLARVRELTGVDTKAGRPSQSGTLRAAVIEGGWFPAEHLDVQGWETVLLKDVTVERVTDVAVDAA